MDVLEIAKILESFKSVPPEQANPHNANVPGSPIYWLVVYLVHKGGAEKINIQAKEFDWDPNRLIDMIDTFKTVCPDFPLLLHEEYQLVTIATDQRTSVEHALEKLSPEHMVPHVIGWRSDPNQKSANYSPQIDVQKFFFDAFRQNPLPQNIRETITAVFRDTPGLTDLDMNRASFGIIVDLKDSLIVISPNSGSEATGYYAHESDVAMLRSYTTRLSSGIPNRSNIFPFLLSLGFTRKAQSLAYSDQVCLLPLWAFIHLTNYLQTLKTPKFSREAFTLLSAESEFSYDGHVIKTINYLKQKAAGIGNM